MLFKDDLYLDARTEHVNRSDELLVELSKLLHSKEHRNLLEEMELSRVKYLNLQNDIVESIQDGKDRKATELGRATATVGAIILENAEIIKKDQFEELNDTRAELESYMVGTIIFIIGMIVLQ